MLLLLFIRTTHMVNSQNLLSIFILQQAMIIVLFYDITRCKYWYLIDNIHEAMVTDYAVKENDYDFWLG